mmetsp:Transcript_93537/g.273906  ORF Transcript_93537/g.273906 Transcript_93537/m.273906 type:complete len:240 (+) Transcript_93537:163-882(+)
MRIAMQVRLDLLVGWILRKVFVPFGVILQAHLHDPHDGCPTVIPLLRRLAGAGRALAGPVLVLLLGEARLHLLQGRGPADVVVLVPLGLLLDAVLYNPGGRLPAVIAFLGCVALLFAHLGDVVYGLLAARRGAEVVHVAGVLHAEVGLDLLEAGVLVELAIVPLIVHTLLQLAHGKDHVAIAGLAGFCSVAGHAIQGLLLLLLLLLLGGLLQLLFDAARRRAHALVVQVLLHNLEAGTL